MNAGASMPMVYKASRAVSTGLTVWDYASSGLDVFRGAERVANGDYWGAVQVSSGALQFLGAIRSTQELMHPRLGGAYRDVPARGGQVHHMPADNVSPVSKNDGPSIWMETLDHRKTASDGGSALAKAYRAAQEELINNNQFRAAIEMDITDVKTKLGAKYQQGVQELRNYVNRLQKVAGWKMLPAK